MPFDLYETAFTLLHTLFHFVEHINKRCLYYESTTTYYL